MLVGCAWAGGRHVSRGGGGGVGVVTLASVSDHGDGTTESTSGVDWRMLIGLMCACVCVCGGGI